MIYSRGKDKSQRPVSVYLNREPLLESISFIYTSGRKAPAKLLQLYKRASHWLEDVRKYAAHGKQTAIILSLFWFERSSLMLARSVMWARWRAKLSVRERRGAGVPYRSPWMPAGFSVITEGLPLLVKGLLTQSPVQMLIG